MRDTRRKPVRILYIHHTLRDQSYNLLLWNLAKRMDRRDFRILVACLREGGPYEEKLRDLGIEVRNFDLKTILDVRIIYHLARLIKEHRIDMIQTSVFPADVYGRISGRLANVKTIISTVHRANDHKQETIYRFLWWVDTLTMTLTSNLVAVSEGVKRYVIGLHRANPDKVKVIYNGIDVSKYPLHVDASIMKRELKLQGCSAVVGYVGRLISVKGLTYLIEAAHRILKRRKNVHFLIVGDGPLRDYLTEKVKKLEMGENVHFVGFRDDIPEVLTTMDIVVQPSLYEGFPLAILEAMCSAKPVVATRVGGVPEVVEHQRTGLLIPPGDAEALTEAIMWLLDDPVKCEKMGRDARRKVTSQFNIERMVTEYEAFYRDLSVCRTVFRR